MPAECRAREWFGKHQHRLNLSKDSEVSADLQASATTQVLMDLPITLCGSLPSWAASRATSISSHSASSKVSIFLNWPVKVVEKRQQLLGVFYFHVKSKWIISTVGQFCNRISVMHSSLTQTNTGCWLCINEHFLSGLVSILWRREGRNIAVSDMIVLLGSSHHNHEEA